MGLREFAQRLTGKKKNEKDADRKQAKSLWNELMKKPDQPAKLAQLYRLYQKNAGNTQAKKALLQIAEATKSETVYKYLQEVQKAHPESNERKDMQVANSGKDTEYSRHEQENAAFVPKFFDESQFYSDSQTSEHHLQGANAIPHREDASDIDLDRHAAKAQQLTEQKNLVRNVTFSEENGLQISNNTVLHENTDTDILYVEELQIMPMPEQNPAVSGSQNSSTGHAGTEMNSSATGGVPAMTEKPEQQMNDRLNRMNQKMQTDLQQNTASRDEIHFNDAPQEQTNHDPQDHTLPNRAAQSDARQNQNHHINSGDETNNGHPINTSEMNKEEDQNKILLFSLNGLIGGNIFPELTAFLPDKSDLGRIGLYFYSYHSRENSLASTEPDQMGNCLCYGIPLLMSDQLYFTTKNQAVAMCPIRYNSGILSESLETDVQTLQTICQRQNLSCLLTGTITLQKGVYQIRTYIYQRQQQTLRILSKNIPYPVAPEIIIEMLNEVTQALASKTGGIFEGKAKQLTAAPLDRRQVLLSMQAKINLLDQYLVYKKYCNRDILPAGKDILDIYVRLLTSEPENQIYILQLLSGMFFCASSGEKTYLKYRAALYKTIDKNKEIPFVRSLIPYVNALLKDV